MEQIETKLDQGLDRSINVVISWVKLYLQNEQKKSDYKPESDVDTISSQACLNVVQQLNIVIRQMKKCVDGENLKNVLNEFGVRLHRVIYDHLQTMQFNTAGAMCAICDVNEYRKCIRELESPLVTQLFDILHALCNLLLVKPENVLEVCTGETLVSITSDSIFWAFLINDFSFIFRITWINQLFANSFNCVLISVSLKTQIILKAL